MGQKYADWIRDPSKKTITPGGETVWVCSACGGGRHIHGVENREHISVCPDCGCQMRYYWETREMVYTTYANREKAMLAEGRYKGYNYWVLSLGTHPCAYVQIPSWSPCFHNDRACLSLQSPYGGVTYIENDVYALPQKQSNGYFIGWDYAHCEDYYGDYNNEENTVLRKHTTAEIVECCKKTIDELVELERFD